jgi:hypothetical protein
MAVFPTPVALPCYRLSPTSEPHKVAIGSDLTPGRKFRCAICELLMQNSDTLKYKPSGNRKVGDHSRAWRGLARQEHYRLHRNIEVYPLTSFYFLVAAPAPALPSPTDF